MIRRALAPAMLVLSVSTLGCPDPGDTKCRESAAYPLAETPVTKIPSLTLLKTAETMALVGLEGSTVRWSLVSEKGVLGTLQAFTLPANIGDLAKVDPEVKAGPWFALTGIGGANNQMVAVFLAPKEGDATVTQVMVIAQNLGGSLVSPRAIFETERGTKPSQLIVAVGSAPSGLHAMVAIGFTNQPGTNMKVFSLGENAQTVKDWSIPLPAKWSCPFWSRSGQSNAPLNLSFVDKDGKPTLVVADVQENGAPGSSVSLEASNIDKGCPTVVPKSGGFVFAWQLDTEIRGGDFLYAGVQAPTQDSASYALINQVTSSGTIPRLIGVAGIGTRTALLWIEPTGPKVGLFDQQTQEHLGADYALTGGNKLVGTPSSVSEIDTMYVTYRTSTDRRLVTVTCDAAN